MTRLTYYPDTDTLDVDFRDTSGRTTETYYTQKKALEAAQEMAQESTDQSREVETYEAEPSGQTLAHYRNDRLEELTIEHASRRAPAAWSIESLRREAAQVAATTERIVESVTHDLRRDRTSFQTGELGPQSPHTSNEAVRSTRRPPSSRW
jgi:uncharacterized protein GlcG (DUF336 family)